MKKTPLIIAVIIVLLFVVYSGFWFWLEGQIKTQTTNFLANTQQDNVSVTARTMMVGGYPAMPTVSFSGQVVVNGSTIEIPALTVRSFFIPHTPLTLEAPQGVSILENAELWSVNRLQINTTVPASLPATMTAADLTAWRDAGGVLTFSKIELEKNTLRVTGSGNVMLDDALQPAGNLQARITGHMAFLQWLQEKQYVESRAGLLASVVLTGLSRTDSVTGELYMDASLTLQSRMFFAGPLRLAEIPIISW